MRARACPGPKPPQPAVPIGLLVPPSAHLRPAPSPSLPACPRAVRLRAEARPGEAPFPEAVRQVEAPCRGGVPRAGVPCPEAVRPPEVPCRGPVPQALRREALRPACRKARATATAHHPGSDLRACRPLPAPVLRRTHRWVAPRGAARVENQPAPVPATGSPRGRPAGRPPVPAVAVACRALRPWRSWSWPGPWAERRERP